MDTSDDSSIPLMPNARDSAKDHETFVTRLDNAYQTNSPLGLYVTEMIELGWDAATRKSIIMKSKYAEDPVIRDALVLFG